MMPKSSFSLTPVALVVVLGGLVALDGHRQPMTTRSGNPRATPSAGLRSQAAGLADRVRASSSSVSANVSKIANLGVGL